MKYKTWTESAQMQGFAPDGKTGFIARIQRYPGSGHDWLWLTIFTPKRIYGFIEEHLPSTRAVTRVMADDVGYRVGNERTPGGGILQRRGSFAAPASAAAFAYGRGHVGPELREGIGPEEISASGVLTPVHSPGSSLENRSEVLGTVSCRLTFRKKTVSVEGFGHWHEQHQFTPRFQTPFTYLSLASQDLALIAVRLPGRAGGFISRGEGQEGIATFEISPVGPARRVRIRGEKGSELEFVASDVHRYTLPIQRRPRPSSVVTAEVEGVHLVGIINDWMEDELEAELPPP